MVDKDLKVILVEALKDRLQDFPVVDPKVTLVVVLKDQAMAFQVVDQDSRVILVEVLRDRHLDFPVADQDLRDILAEVLKDQEVYFQAVDQDLKVILMEVRKDRHPDSQAGDQDLRDQEVDSQVMGKDLEDSLEDLDLKDLEDFLLQVQVLKVFRVIYKHRELKAFRMDPEVLAVFQEDKGPVQVLMMVLLTMGIIQQFQGNLNLTIQYILRYLKLVLSAINSSGPVTTLMLKLDVKYSMFVPIIVPLTSSAPTALSFINSTLFVCGGTNLTAIRHPVCII